MATKQSSRSNLALGHFLALDEGWDSYDGKPIASEAVKTAEALSAVPCCDGGVQLELYAGGVELIVEIAPSGLVREINWGMPGVA